MKVGFIGGGNMAGALIGGLKNSGKIAPENLMVSDMDMEKLESFSVQGIVTTADHTMGEKNCDVIVFAVKPNVIENVLRTMKGDKEKIYISIAAGVTLSFLEEHLGSDKKIVRTMPNTPALVGCGMTVVTPNMNVSEEEAKMVEELFSGVGAAIRLEEKYIDAAGALHGSSPAYIYMLIDAMADSGVAYGIPKAVSLQLAAKAVEGSAKMVLESDQHPEKLKDNVCSPGGTTIAAVCSLEKTGFRTSIQQAIEACIKRTKEIAK